MKQPLILLTGIELNLKNNHEQTRKLPPTKFIVHSTLRDATTPYTNRMSSNKFELFGLKFKRVLSQI